MSGSRSKRVDADSASAQFQGATGAQARALLASRKLEHVVVLGGNGTMGYGSAALFTTTVPKVTLLARSTAKAEEGLAAAIRQVRSPTVAARCELGSYDGALDDAVGDADLVFEALTEDFAIKKQMFDRVEKARSNDSIVATVTSGLSINELAEGRGDSFRKNFLGLHFFNPPNTITGAELIAGRDTDPGVADFVEVYSRLRLGREMVRAADKPGFAGNRVGFKVLNEAAQLAEELGPVLVDRIIGPYTGRSLTPLATTDLVGWDIHRAIVENIYENAPDEARDTLRLPEYMGRLMELGTLGDKSGGGFFKRDGKTRLALDPRTGDYTAEDEVHLPELDYIDDVAALYAQGRYRDGIELFLAVDDEHARIARKVVAGYISYAFHRVGEVAETINDIDRIMGAGFNWAPPSVLVDTMGPRAAVDLIEQNQLPVPEAIARAASSGEPGRFFHHPTINTGKYFVAR
jgi:3-hydroxyacyl-CoA dehydrogenase